MHHSGTMTSDPSQPGPSAYDLLSLETPRRIHAHKRSAGADAPDRKTKRVRVVVVGSGWGACSFVKAMRKYDAEVLSCLFGNRHAIQARSLSLAARAAGLTRHSDGSPLLPAQRYDVTLISPRNYFLYTYA